MFTTLTFSAEELFDTPGRLGLTTLVNNGLVGVLDHTIAAFSLIARDTQSRNGLYLDAVVSYSNDPMPAIAAPYRLQVFPARGVAQGMVKALAFQADNPGWFFSPIFALFSDSGNGANGLPYLVWMVSSTDPNAGDNWQAGAAIPPVVLAGDAAGPFGANTVVAIRNKAVPAPAVGGTRLVYDLTTDALVWYSTPVYASLAAAVAGQANQIIGERITVYSDPATGETGTYVVNALTGDVSDYTKKSDATDTAAEVGIVDAGGYYPGITEVEGALQRLGFNDRTLRTEGLALGGFIEPATTVSAAFVDLTRTLTLTPVGLSYSFYSDGVFHTKAAAEAIQIPNAEGAHYIYYDGAGVLQTTQVFDLAIITRYAIVAIIHWDASNLKQIYFGREYRHTTWIGGLTHARLHTTVGYALESGGLLGSFTIGNGNLDAHAQCAVSQTVAWDEDARFVLAARLATGDLPVYYRLGADASNIWRVDEGGAQASFPVRSVVGGRAYFNELVGATWQLTEVDNNDFVLAFIAASNDTDRRFVAFMGQAQYPTATAARAAIQGAVDELITNGLPIEEFKFLGAIIIQTSTSYSNVVKSRVIEIETGVPYLDLRGSVIGRLGSSASIGDHNLLAGLQGGQVDEYYHLTALEYSNLGADYVLLDNELVQVVNLTTAEATAEGWTFTEAGGELTITDVPTLAAPADIRIPDFVDGLPVTTIGNSGVGALFRKAGTVTNLTGVTSLMLRQIGSQTFSNCTALVTVNLPSLSSCGGSAFSNCTALVTVDLPRLAAAGNEPFYQCTSLVTVSLPSLLTLGELAFQSCTSLVTINLPSLTALGGEAFSNCTALLTVNLGAHFVPAPSPGAFSGGANANAVVYYTPGDAGYGAFWPDDTAITIGPDARPAVPSLSRWSEAHGVAPEGYGMVRVGASYAWREVSTETITLGLVDAFTNVIATISDVSAITTVEWAVTLYDLVTPRVTRYNIMASDVNGVSLLTVSGLGPDYGEVFELATIAGPTFDLVLHATPVGANWNAIVTRMVVHRA